ncbi:MAG: glycosyltransferase [Ferruginibacter sp.]
MKILIAIPFLSNGGAERAMFNLALYFRKTGAEVSIIASSPDAPNKEKLPPGFQFYTLDNPLPLNRPSFISSTKKIAAIFREIKPDVVLSTSEYLNVSVLLGRRLVKGKFKVIISQQINAGIYMKELPFKNRLLIRAIHRFVISRADVIVGASEGVAQNFAALYNLPYPSDKVKFVFNPIYESSIEQRAKEEIVNENFVLGSPSLVTVGRLISQKNQSMLFRAFKLVLKELPMAKLFIVGIGPDEAILKKLVAVLHLEDSVIFLGYQENPYAYIDKCDLFVLSSDYEGFGNVVVEALATGTNVVSTDCPSGPAEILNHGEYGFLSPVADEEKLALKIKEAIARPLPPEKLLSRAREFNIEKKGEEYLEIFRKALAK